MLSLKQAFDRAAPVLGKTPTALYERQRALVSAGLLQQTAGRGPGSGVRATPETVATMLVAVLAAENLSEAVNRTRDLLAVRGEFGGVCVVTGEATFGGALATIIGLHALARRVTEIRVSRSSLGARIDFQFNHPMSFRGVEIHQGRHTSGFRSEYRGYGGIDVSASIRWPTLMPICFTALPQIHDDGSQEEYDRWRRDREKERIHQREREEDDAEGGEE